MFETDTSIHISNSHVVIDECHVGPVQIMVWNLLSTAHMSHIGVTVLSVNASIFDHILHGYISPSTIAAIIGSCTREKLCHVQVTCRSCAGHMQAMCIMCRSHAGRVQVMCRSQYHYEVCCFTNTILIVQPSLADVMDPSNMRV